MCLKIRRYTPLFFIYHIKNYIVWQYQICIFYGQNTAFSQKSVQKRTSAVNQAYNLTVQAVRIALHRVVKS